MLRDFLENNKVFKLVCGAGNEDTKEVEKLVTLYSASGCNIFDVSANPDVIDAAKRGIENSKITKDRYICVSVGIKGDPHVSKALITESCKKCGKCEFICPQNAIKYFKVNNSKCIGCGKCSKICNHINMVDKSKTLEEILPPLIKKGIDCIELHASGYDEEDVISKWNYIKNNFDGIQSLCIDRSKLGNEGVIKRIKNLITDDKKIIIQADGYPMSGGKDDYKSTLQAVAMAEIIQNAELPVYIFLSGGTNSKSMELSKLCNININGIAIGSFARKIVKEYVSRDDFLTNEEVFNKALVIAKKLVEACNG